MNRPEDRVDDINIVNVWLDVCKHIVEDMVDDIEIVEHNKSKYY